MIIWGLAIALMALPLAAAAFSPLLAWRGPVYIAAGFAGILAFALMLIQPLLMSRLLVLPSFKNRQRAHLWLGTGITAAVIIHVAGLWITSPPDVIDALLFRSPTPFSDWGVIAMWLLLLAGLLAWLRQKLPLKPKPWRRWHTSLALLTVSCTAIHAILIEGTMETISKVLLCAAVITATLYVIRERRIWPK